MAPNALPRLALMLLCLASKGFFGVVCEPCGVSMRRGRRAGMEDRAVCLADFAALQGGPASRNFGDAFDTRFLAIFDGHEGQRASQAAVDRLPFALAQELFSEASVTQVEQPANTDPESNDRDARTKVKLAAEKAIKGAMAVVDQEFLAEARKEQLADGTTAAIALHWSALDLLMVAHIGDSKALLCQEAGREESNELLGQGKLRLEAVELTDDHSLLRPDEAARVAVATGNPVMEGSGNGRLNGELAVTRAIGDLEYRELGLVSDPDVAFVDLAKLAGRKHSFLILASDGVFEGISPQDVCDIAGAVAFPMIFQPFSFASAPPDPIALGDMSVKGDNTVESGSENFSTSTSEHYFSTRGHWGLQGCTDCEKGVRLEPSSVPKRTAASQNRFAQSGSAHKQQQQHADNIATAILEEAYNRMSMDNLAIIVQQLTVPNASSTKRQKAGQGPEGSTQHQTSFFQLSQPQQVVSGPEHDYLLNTMVALVPRVTFNLATVSHVHWDGQPVRIGVSAPCMSSSSCIVSRRDEDDITYDQVSTCKTSKSYCSWDNEVENLGNEVGLRELPSTGDASSLIVNIASLPIDDGQAPSFRDPRQLQLGSSGTGNLSLGLPSSKQGKHIGSEEQDRASDSWMHAEYAEYKLRSAFAKGAFGEVWRCTRIPVHQTHPVNEEQWSESGNSELEEEGHFVLKRIMVEKGASVRLSGERERYFGQKFNLLAANSMVSASWQPENDNTTRTQNAEQHENNTTDAASIQEQANFDHLVRFVEAFETNRGKELWLVFRDEGVSLHSLMYETASVANAGEDNDSDRSSKSGQQVNHVEQKGSDADDSTASAEIKILGPSRWWWRVRRQEGSHNVLIDVMRQVMLALAVVHDANVTHRDVKPENLLVTFKDGPIATSPRSNRFDSIHVRLIDFGSAVDTHSSSHLYGNTGPSEMEQTAEYAPPETVFGSFWKGGGNIVRRTWPYDIWSAAVVWLELVIGTPHVFQISARTQALLTLKLKLENKPADERQQIFLLRGMMELCIYPALPSWRRDNTKPSFSDSHDNMGGSLLQWSCSDMAILELIKSRDPSHQGVGSVLIIRLLRAMLHWNPSQRPTAREVLRHVVFVADSSDMSAINEDQVLAACSKRHRSQVGWC